MFVLSITAIISTSTARGELTANGLLKLSAAHRSETDNPWDAALLPEPQSLERFFEPVSQIETPSSLRADRAKEME